MRALIVGVHDRVDIRGMAETGDMSVFMEKDALGVVSTGNACAGEAPGKLGVRTMSASSTLVLYQVTPRVQQPLRASQPTSFLPS